eukprot:5552393-Pyramimonas_sp.AAC.1
MYSRFSAGYTQSVQCRLYTVGTVQAIYSQYSAGYIYSRYSAGYIQSIQCRLYTVGTVQAIYIYQPGLRWITVSMYYATPFVLRYELRVGALWRLPLIIRCTNQAEDRKIQRLLAQLDQPEEKQKEPSKSDWNAHTSASTPRELHPPSLDRTLDRCEVPLSKRGGPAK